MLHAKFQHHQTSGSDKEDFKVFFFYHKYGHGSHLGHMT